jgi:hypothetical protein
MTREEIEKKRKELTNILIEEDAEKRLEKLQQLAKEVGASITRMEKVEIQRDSRGAVRYQTSNEITETEIVHNIQVALETWTMVDVCKTSARNCKVSLSATVIAFLAMLAAWVAVWFRVEIVGQ